MQLLLLPSPWMFEALESWLTVPEPTVASDYELVRGMKTYSTALAGAYHATRLPILEYLHKIRRQAGAIAFLEMTNEWIPLGVWRFREIAREALRRSAATFSTLEESLSEVGMRLQSPLARWEKASRLLTYFRAQKRIERYLQ